MNEIMKLRIETLTEKKLIGVHLNMSQLQNRTAELWRSFMPRRKEISNTISPDLFSMQIYDESYSFKNFNPAAEFVKWAAVEVSDFETIPPGMKPFTLIGGMYAVFHYKGLPRNGDTFFRSIFGDWIPNSDYELDNRPHFEILGEKYKNDDPDSEEEIWIPVKVKKKERIL